MVDPSSIIKPTDPTAHLVCSTILARFCLHFWVARIHVYIYIILSHFCWVKPWLKPWLSRHLSTRPALPALTGVARWDVEHGEGESDPTPAAWRQRVAWWPAAADGCGQWPTYRWFMVIYHDLWKLWFSMVKKKDGEIFWDSAKINWTWVRSMMVCKL